MKKDILVSLTLLLVGMLTLWLLGTSLVELLKLTLLVPVLIASGYGFLCLSAHILLKFEDLMSKKG